MFSEVLNAFLWWCVPSFNLVVCRL